MSERDTGTISGAEGLFSLSGRVALVTGSTRGLGLEMATALARCGARVYLHGRDPDKLARQCAAFAQEGLSLGAAPFDIADMAAGEAAVSAVADREGRLDILVNNVGPRLRRPIEAIDAAGLRGMLDAHLVAPFVLARAAAEAMKPGGYGRIVMVASVSGVRGARGDAAYIAAKGGVIALGRALAAEYGAFGITCNTLVPGRFLTESNAGSDRPPSGPLGRWGDPAEIAGACVFLASPASSFVTAATLEVDGGVANCF